MNLKNFFLVPILASSLALAGSVSAIAADTPPVVPTCNISDLGLPAEFDRFVDIQPDQMFDCEILFVAKAKISTGWSDGTFRALENINRDAMAAFLFRLAELEGDPSVRAYTPPPTSPFTDVAEDNMFYKEIAWLNGQGISTGWEDKTFRPLDSINRDAIAVFLYRFAKMRGVEMTPVAPDAESPFADVSTNNMFFEEILWTYDNGIFAGWADPRDPSGQNTFQPFQPLARDAMAAGMFRTNHFLQKTITEDQRTCEKDVKMRWASVQEVDVDGNPVFEDDEKTIPVMLPKACVELAPTPYTNK